MSLGPERSRRDFHGQRTQKPVERLRTGYTANEMCVIECRP